MSHLALYREWRPQTFAEVVGQKHVVTTLTNALRQGKLAHAYIFSGPRGTGKTSLAKILAKAVNCETPIGSEPCNACPACLGVNSGRIVDVVEMDAASNRGVDEIRSLLEQVRYAPTEVKRKVYIIDEVHMLTPEAFNALLKTLEEPPEYCLFILATTEVHKVPATVASRCQRFDFNRLSAELVVARLREVANRLEGTEVEDAALWYIARTTEGGLRDALSMLDQVMSFGDGRIAVEQVAEVTGGVSSEQLGHVLGSVLRREHAELLSNLSGLWECGTDPTQLVIELIAYARDAILLKSGVPGADAENRVRYDPTFPIIVQSAASGSVLSIAERLAHLQAELRYQSQARLFVEIGLLSCLDDAHAVDSQPDRTAEKDSSALRSIETSLRQEIVRLAKRVSELEQRVANQSGARKQPVSDTQSTSADASLSPSDGSVTGAVEGGVARLRQQTARLALRSMRADEGRLFRDLQSQWQHVLDDIKKKSVQARAWLHGGQPVALLDDRLIVTVKSAIHASTIAKSYQDLVNEAVAQRCNSSLQVHVVWEDEWQRIQDTGAIEDPVSGQDSMEREPWVKRVVELFGEDHVTIVDD